MSDAFDIIDARVLNYKVEYSVFLERKVNKQLALLNINRRLADALDRRHFQIDQPIIVDDIFSVITRERGVISVTNLNILPITAGSEFASGVGFGEGPGGRVYSTGNFNTAQRIRNGILRGDPGTIFELRYPEFDIVGRAS